MCLNLYDDLDISWSPRAKVNLAGCVMEAAAQRKHAIVGIPRLFCFTVSKHMIGKTVPGNNWFEASSGLSDLTCSLIGLHLRACPALP